MADDYREIAVPDGQLAEVVTYLEMRRPPTRPTPSGPWRLERRSEPDLDWYLALYREVGEAWLWYSRLAMPRAEASEILSSEGVEVFALTREGRDVGLAELDRRQPSAVEIAFFGVAASEIGSGAGRFMMAALLERAWSTAPDRVWLHTCTLDHPNALPFYQRQGFRAYKRTLGVYPDPRAEGVLDRTAAAHIPLIEPEAGEASE